MASRISLFSVLFIFSSISMSNEIEISKSLGELFTPAYERNGTIAFDPQFEVDWEILTPSNLKDIDLANPSDEELEILKSNRDMYGNSEFEFEADIPPGERDRMHCFLISTKGIQKLEVLRLSGTARFSFDRKSTLWNRIYYGSVVSKVNESTIAKQGGFSMCAAQPISFDQAETELTKETIKQYFFSDNTLSQAAHVEDEGFWKILTKYTFRVVGQDIWFKFFQLAPDEQCLGGCCSNRYFIVRADKFDAIRWNLSKCDI